MSVNYVALGKRIGYFRMQCGNITQEALASKINRSREFLAKIEKGTEPPQRCHSGRYCRRPLHFH